MASVMPTSASMAWRISELRVVSVICGALMVRLNPLG